MVDTRPELLDAGDSRPPGGRAGWLVGGLAVVVVAAGLVAARPSSPGTDVVLALADHRGSVLSGQRYVRLWFSLTASGGTPELEEVAVVLGGVREQGALPALPGRGGELRVLVDVVPPCPDALRELPAGRLEVRFRDDAGQHSASLPLPVEGSLPRLVQRQCDELARAVT